MHPIYKLLSFNEFWINGVLNGFKLIFNDDVCSSACKNFKIRIWPLSLSSRSNILIICLIAKTHTALSFLWVFVYLKQCLLVLCVLSEAPNCQFDLGFKDQGHSSAARNANCSLIFWLMVFIFGTMIAYGVYITQ